MKTEAEVLYEAMDSEEWEFTRHSSASFLTDEANEARKWSIRRKLAPYCGADGERLWVGSSPSEALNKAKQSFGI